jgi:hypothetical protein
VLRQRQSRGSSCGRGLTRACSRPADLARGALRAAPSRWRREGSVSLCGRRLEGPQLMRIFVRRTDLAHLEVALSTYKETCALERELRRIGIDEDRLSGLASPGPMTFADVLTFLRRLPTGIGHEAFVAALEAGGMQPGLGANGVPPADATFRAPDIDELESLYDELERVWPDRDRPDGWGLVFSADRAVILNRLRELPDQAGAEAVSRALRHGPNTAV